MYSHTKHQGIVFRIMDNGGPTDDREAYIEDAVAEISRSKSLCHKANMTDPMTRRTGHIWKSCFSANSTM
jgi:hypothetical protein